MRLPAANGELALMIAASRFPLLGEPLVLDLVNTRVRRNSVAADLLDKPAALTAWLRAEHARLASTATADAADLGAVRTLRDAVGHLLRAKRERAQPPSAALGKVNRVLANPAARSRLTWNAAGPRSTPPTRRSRRGALLRALAADAVALLTGPQAERSRKCAHPDCVLQFVARNPRRRWCSDALCGNRARVARHYLRRHAAR